MAFLLCNQPGAFVVCAPEPRAEEATIAGQRSPPFLSVLLLQPGHTENDTTSVSVPRIQPSEAHLSACWGEGGGRVK